MSETQSERTLEVSIIMNEALRRWDRYGFKDKALWGAFKDNFKSFSMEDFDRVSMDDTRALRDYLRRHGVWVEDSQLSITESLFNLLQERRPTQWTEKEIKACIDDGEVFDSGRITRLLETDFGRRPTTPAWQTASIPPQPRFSLPAATAPALGPETSSVRYPQLPFITPQTRQLSISKRQAGEPRTQPSQDVRFQDDFKTISQPQPQPVKTFFNLFKAEDATIQSLRDVKSELGYQETPQSLPQQTVSKPDQTSYDLLGVEHTTSIRNTKNQYSRELTHLDKAHKEEDSRNSAVVVGGSTLGGGLSCFFPHLGLVYSNFTLSYGVVFVLNFITIASTSTDYDLWHAFKGGTKGSVKVERKRRGRMKGYAKFEKRTKGSERRKRKGNGERG